MIILGLNAYRGDSSACIVVDGKLIAAAEEERFKRIKHWAGFPTGAIKRCVNLVRIKIKEIDQIAGIGTLWAMYSGESIPNSSANLDLMSQSRVAFLRWSTLGPLD